ncbi:MAG: tripartite tricarboxylate transporter TctB family protein [Woeseiaceae bacterium]|jgi:putative tricarboxylic transport membrane protein
MARHYTPISKQRIADLVVLLLLAALVAIYCGDAINASTDILNLILVLPVTLIVLVLCLVQFVSTVANIRVATEERERFVDVVPVAGLFAAYVLSLPWLGFDIGTCLFLGAFLWLHGERRWPWLFGYSMSFAFVLSIFFSKMLPYSMPMLILPVAAG